MKYSDRQIENFLEGIYEGRITVKELPEDLYFAIADYLKKALYKGYGGNLKTVTGKNLELLQELRENIYLFSAAKTYQEVRYITDLLYDENGNIRSKTEFRDLGRESFATWNDAWGEAEYNTAIAQAQNAVKWGFIEAQKDVLPILRYITSGSDNVCEICAPLDGLTAPVDDDVWDSIMPCNHFGCLCVVEQLEEGEVTTNRDEIVEQVEQEMDDLFKMNPGKDRVVFSDDHPYFDIAPKDKGLAENNFGLPIPEED